MTDEDRAMAEARAGVYRFLAGVFLAPIPPEGAQFIRQVQVAVAGLPEVDVPGELAVGLRLLKQSVPEASPVAQLALAIERTRLCRGVMRTDAPPPPYEAQYLAGTDQAAALRSVVAAYQQAGWAVNDEQHERADYIGMELSFMARLCEEEAAAGDDAARLAAVVDTQRRFLGEHLAAWAPDYCREMLKHARAPFFLGIAHLLMGFLAEETQG